MWYFRERFSPFDSSITLSTRKKSFDEKKLKSLQVRKVVYILYNVCAMILIFVRLGVISFTSLRQKSHLKIKAKCHKYLVKVSQMTRVPQVEYHWCTLHHTVELSFLSQMRSPTSEVNCTSAYIPPTSTH